MYLDVVDLQEFYATRLGRAAGAILERKVRRLWPDVRGMRVLGLGYGIPFLTPFLEEAERVAAFMPAQQGVVRWPRGRANIVALTEDARLPLPDASYDRVMVAHALENTEQIRAMIREVWRVLTPEGRLLLIVPNRRGFWSHSERTPFGWGHPYSRGQLKRFLSESMLTPIDWEGALYLPPMRSRLGIRSIGGLERIGDWWCPGLAGIIIVQAEKRVYAQPRSGLKEPARRPKPALVPKPAATALLGRDSTETSPVRPAR